MYSGGIVSPLANVLGAVFALMVLLIALDQLHLLQFSQL
jgi:hypothetical protein